MTTETDVQEPDFQARDLVVLVAIHSANTRLFGFDVDGSSAYENRWYSVRGNKLSRQDDAVGRSFNSLPAVATVRLVWRVESGWEIEDGALLPPERALALVLTGMSSVGHRSFKRALADIIRASNDRWLESQAVLRQLWPAPRAWCQSFSEVEEGITESDLELIESWTKSWGPFPNDLRRARVREQMRAARCAELAALTFFQTNGLGTRDLSIEQMDETADDLWKTADIEISLEGGEVQLVDVKNTRQTFGGQTYSKVLIPRFKQDHWGRDVRYLGVRSAYRRINKKSQQVERCELGLDLIEILGETTIKSWQALQEEFNSSRLTLGRRTFSTDGQNPRKTLLPPWVFVHPQGDIPSKYLQTAHYSNEKKRYVVPLALASGVPPPPASTTDLEDWQHRLVVLLSSRGRQARSLPWLFLTLIRAALDDDGVRWGRKWTLAGLREILYLEGFAPFEESHRWKRWPLGVFDPLGVVHNLCRTLCILLKNCPNLDSFEEFRLEGELYLRGRKTNGSWQTLVTHCGGPSTRNKFVTCAKFPLIYGREQSCASCGGLICSDKSCRHCLASFEKEQQPAKAACCARRERAVQV